MSALARWDAFLAQIKGRHEQVRAEAQAEGRQFIAGVAGGGDYLPLTHQLGAVKNRLHDLERKIMETWHAQVDDAIMGEGNSVEVRDAVRDKAIAGAHALEDARDELEISLFAGEWYLAPCHHWRDRNPHRLPAGRQPAGPAWRGRCRHR